MSAQPLAVTITGLPGRKSKVVLIDTGYSVEQLMNDVSANCLSGIGIDQFYLIFGNHHLKIGRTLDSYHVKHGAMMGFCIRTHGGSALIPLPGYISLTNEPCCMSYDDDPAEFRAKMPCGCSISVGEMSRYIDNELATSKSNLLCPNCGTEWQYFCIRHVLSAIRDLTDLQDVDKKVLLIYAAKKPGVRQCPFCGVNCERDQRAISSNNIRVVCLMCTTLSGKEVEFCWKCLKSWKTGGTKDCGNAGCRGLDTRINHLKTCPTKTIGQVPDVPSVRACAKCGTLVNHIDQCKHMACLCGYKFCFVCLKPPQDVSADKWYCGGPYTPCDIAPRQTTVVDTE